MDYDANEITVEEIEALLRGDGVTTSVTDDLTEPPATQPTEPPKKEEGEGIEKTQAFANRLKTATAKARAEEREVLAKELGYTSYKEMQEAKTANLLKEKGLDPEEIAPVVEELLKKRLAEDPRLQELQEFRQKKIEDWAKKELVELKTLTNGKITKIEDVPKGVIELWKTKGSLKAAYLELEGEKLIKEMRTGAQNRTTTNHLTSPTGNPVLIDGVEKRPFTQKEKQIYKVFNPSVTDEQLNKLMKDKN